VAPGAFGMWDLPAFTRAPGDPDLLVGRVADDLAGVTAILAVFDAADRIDPRRRTDVRALLTRGEEEGFVGALAAMHGRRLPRAARIVALEASKALPHAPQGAGPILRVGDRTSIFDDALTRWIGGVAADLAGSRGTRFLWQRRLMDGGTCEATVFQRFGHPSAALCVALGNYHNMGARGRIAPETIRLSDLVGLARLLEAMLRDDRRAPRPGARDPLRARLDRLLADRRHELRRDPFA
jgi:endoglucanase